MNVVDKAKEQDSTFSKIVYSLACLFIIGVAYKALLIIWGIATSAFSIAATMTDLTAKLLVGLLLIILSAFIFTLILDVLRPLLIPFRRRRKIIRSIKRSNLPRYATFCGEYSNSAVDKFLARVLHERFVGMNGERMVRNAFHGSQNQYMEFKRDQLHRLLLGAYRLSVEMNLFVPIYHAYLSGNDELESWMVKATEAERQSRPMRNTEILLHYLTIGKFGLSADKAWRRIDIGEFANNQEKFFGFLWQYFSELPVIEQFVDLRIEELMVPEEMEQVVYEEYQETEPKLLMAPAVIDVESETANEETTAIVWEDESERSQREREAVQIVETAIEMFDHDGEPWTEPERLFEDMSEALGSALHVHPDEDYVYRQFAQVNAAKQALSGFEDEFEYVMQADQMPDEQYKWVAEACAETGEDFEELSTFKRRCLRHYVQQAASKE